MSPGLLGFGWKFQAIPPPALDHGWSAAEEQAESLVLRPQRGPPCPQSPALCVSSSALCEVPGRDQVKQDGKHQLEN